MMQCISPKSSFMPPSFFFVVASMQTPGLASSPVASVYKRFHGFRQAWFNFPFLLVFRTSSKQSYAKVAARL